MTAIPVIYRKFKEGDVVAFFPTLPGDMSITTCLSYQHVGQHSPAAVVLMSELREPPWAECDPLHKELINQVGYDLKLYHRRQPWMDDDRLATLQNRETITDLLNRRRNIFHDLTPFLRTAGFLSGALADKMERLVAQLIEVETEIERWAPHRVTWTPFKSVTLDSSYALEEYVRRNRRK